MSPEDFANSLDPAPASQGALTPPTHPKEEKMQDKILAGFAREEEIRDRAKVAAAYWLNTSPHERTEEDGLVLARYAQSAIQRIADLEEAARKWNLTLEPAAIDEYAYASDVQEPTAIDMIPAGTHAEKKVEEATDDLDVAIDHLEMGGDWKHVIHLMKRARWALRPRRKGER